MKKIGIILLLSLLLVELIAFPALAEGNSGGIYGGIDAQNAVIAGKVVENATAAIVYELNSDTMLIAQNVDERMYPASLVKVMTALLAVENRNLDAMATVTQEALNAANSSTSANLQVGEKISVRELLYCMLVGSANDAAAVLAVHIGGSVDAFVSMMNSRAAELGCTNTNFVDPHGLTSKNQYSTARDMVRIFAAVTQNADFCEIFGATRHTVPETNLSSSRELKTQNYLMDKTAERYYDSRVTGGRTGVAADRSRILGVTAGSGNMQVIAIVFGSKSKYAADNYTVERYGSFPEISQLLDATISKYRIAQVFYEDQVIAQRTVANGDNDLVLVPAKMQMVIIPKDVSVSEITYRYSDAGRIYSAPIEKGSVQGNVEVWYNGMCLASVELLARNHVPVVNAKKVNFGDQNGAGGWLIFVVLGACVICVLVVIQRQYNIRKHRAARRRAAERRRENGPMGSIRGGM